MAQVPRPPKQGNNTTYVAKVAAGYTKILAGEIDADFDTIYNAWNNGADATNLKDGSITGAKLAADAVGPRELADGAVFTYHLQDLAVTTAKLANGSVTDPKIASVAWGKVTGAPTTYPPSGAASGDLAGSYPAPSIRDGAVTAAKLAPGAVTGIALGTDSVGAAQIAAGAVATAELADGAVTRPKLAPGALPGATVSVAITTFNTNIHNQWITVATLPALVTRGANPVFLISNHGLSALIATQPGNFAIRWTRNGAHLCNTAAACDPGTLLLTLPVPTLPYLDIVPAAGSYTYALEVNLGNSVTSIYFQTLNTGCGLLAVELG